MLPGKEPGSADFHLALREASLRIFCQRLSVLFPTCSHALWAVTDFWCFQFLGWVFMPYEGAGLLNMTLLYAEYLQALCLLSVPYSLSSSRAVTMTFMWEQHREKEGSLGDFPLPWPLWVPAGAEKPETEWIWPQTGFPWNRGCPWLT